MTVGKKTRTRDRHHYPTAVPPEDPRIQQLEHKLRESEENFRSLAEQSLVGTFIIQEDILRYVNRRFAEMFGYSPGEIIDRMRLQDLVVQDDRQVIEASIRQCASHRLQSVHKEFRGLKRTGTISAEVFASRAIYLGRPAIIGIVLDLTEKMKLEQQLRQAQKMESVGQLTSGIAHDFNNLLTAIIGYATALENKIKPDDPARNYAFQILTIADRAATLIQSLLTFSRKQTTDLRVIDINDAIKRAEKFVRWIIGEKVALRVSAAAGHLVVNADAGQIEQVLVNLATNAADAMPQGGTLSIETGIANSDALNNTTETMYEEYAVVSVTDTGAGMDEKTREKIFEPFFTTKDPGRGTGLGLFMVNGIIRQHKGYIRCDSQPGAGTCFRIYLPLLAVSREPDETSGQALPDNGKHQRCSETVLVLKGDESMRTSAKTTIEAYEEPRFDSVVRDAPESVER